MSSAETDWITEGMDTVCDVCDLVHRDGDNEARKIINHFHDFLKLLAPPNWDGKLNMTSTSFIRLSRNDFKPGFPVWYMVCYMLKNRSNKQQPTFPEQNAFTAVESLVLVPFACAALGVSPFANKDPARSIQVRSGYLRRLPLGKPGAIL